MKRQSLIAAVVVAMAVAPVASVSQAAESPETLRPQKRVPRLPRPRPGLAERPIPPDIPSDDHRAWYEAARTQTADTWLGVQLAPVPPALAAHLDLQPGAVMVRNIFRDSPADKAGLDRHDIIVAADGQAVTGGIEGFSRYVAGRKPGDAIELTIRQKGLSLTRTVELTRRPAAWHELQRKYEDEPGFTQPLPFEFRGKILRPGPRGWELHDLGPLPDVPRLPQDPEEFAEWYGDPGQLDELRRVDKHGQVLHVKRAEDGSIIVRRYRSGNEDQADVRTYSSMEDLAERDAEAFELLQSARPRPRLPDHLDNLMRKLPQYRQEWEQYRDSVREHLDALRRQLDTLEDDLEDYWPDHRKQWHEWGERFFQGPLKRWKEGFDSEQPDPLPPPPGQAPAAAPAAPPPGPPLEPPPPPPATRFEVSPDGKITVHVRQGDRELTMVFESRDQFAREAPDLHQQFEELARRVR